MSGILTDEILIRSQRTLKRIIPRVQTMLAKQIAADPISWQEFRLRLDSHFDHLFSLLYPLYGSQYDFFFHLESLIHDMAASWFSRNPELKIIDKNREINRAWFQSNQMLGGVCYVDLFAENLSGIENRIPYFKELGLTYLHLMPLFRVPQGENDGGYAISSYREVNPALGTMDQLSHLASELRKAGISLVVDFVFNHTSDEHDWAIRARSGDPEYREYYWMFPNRDIPDQYERTLREIFPDEHPGAFTFFPEINQWVWTTFHSYQWDLNYRNPAVFNAMARELLALANAGIEVLRLDAVAFIWKQMGTSCENLPEAHQIIQAFNTVARISAPALLFKSEAIVHPDQVIQYIRPDECQLSYNPLLMALLWESLATREVRLLNVSLKERQHLPAGTSWINYVRVHDDIGWTFSDEDAGRLWINGYDHRRFLNSFYTGRFPGSFARGLPFQENPKTGDCRISGTCASLAGLEKAVREGNDAEVNLAIQRILLIHGLIMSIGGIPLIYLGDELGTCNDYSYRNDPSKAKDSRWVHRPRFNQERFEHRNDTSTIEGRIYSGMLDLIALRKKHPIFGDGDFQLFDSLNPHVFGFTRQTKDHQIIILANFSELAQPISEYFLARDGKKNEYFDLRTGRKQSTENFVLQPYQLIFLSQEQLGKTD